MRNKVFILFIFLLCCIEAMAQRNGINWPKGYFINGPLAIARGNGVYPDTNLTAHFGIDSTTKGMILPRGLVQSMVNPQGHVGVFMYNYVDSVLYHLDGTRLVRYITYKDTAFIRDVVGIPTLDEVLGSGNISTENMTVNSANVNGTLFVADGANMNGGITATDTSFFQSLSTGLLQLISPTIDEGTILTMDANGYVRKSARTASSIGTVTSVGITPGTSGTDVNVSGSPVTTSGSITLNIPSASATARGLVTTGTQSFAGAKTFTNPVTVQTTTTPQRRLAYDGTNLIDESIASNGAITYNLQGSAPTYTYQINGVTKVFMVGTGQTTWTTTSEMIAQFGNTQTDKVFIVSGSGGQFPSGSSGLMFGSSYVSTIPAIAVNTQFGIGSYSMTFSNINNFILNVTRLRGNFNATSAFAAYTFTIPNSTFTGQALIGYFTNNVESGMSFNPSTGSNALTGVGSELRVRATGTWAGLARAYDVGFDASNTYANGTAVGYNTDQSVGIAFRNSNASARNLFMGKVGIGSTTAPTDQVEVTGNIALMAAGNKLKIATGTNATLNTFTFTSGTATVNNTSVTANSIILIDMKTASGTALGVQYSYTISAGTSFTVTSKKADNTTETNDNSTLSYWIIN